MEEKSIEDAVQSILNHLGPFGYCRGPMLAMVFLEV